MLRLPPCLTRTVTHLPYTTLFRSIRRILGRRRLAGMATWYPLILLLHLSCAIVFIGAVAFEVLVLESLHRHFEHDIMARIEAAVMARARRFMPFVVALL